MQAAESFREALGVDGLEEVVEGVGFVGPDGEGVVGGDKDNSGREGELGEQVEAAGRERIWTSRKIASGCSLFAIFTAAGTLLASPMIWISG